MPSGSSICAGMAAAAPRPVAHRPRPDRRAGPSGSQSFARPNGRSRCYFGRRCSQLWRSPTTNLWHIDAKERGQSRAHGRADARCAGGGVEAHLRAGPRPTGAKAISRARLICAGLKSSDCTCRLPGSPAGFHRQPRTFCASLLPKWGSRRQPRVPACSRRREQAPRCRP